MKSESYDLVVIGAGPGGYVAAIRAAQLGRKVACVEKEKELGGTCLRVGCIPSKALLESSELYEQAREELARHGIRAKGVQLDLKAMMDRKLQNVKTLSRGVDALFKKNKITRHTGTGKIIEPGKVRVRASGGEVELKAKHVLVATGSKPASLPGIEFDGDRITTSTEALSYERVPSHLVVVGAGAVGLELGSVWRRLGAKVTVVELLDRILPEMDGEIAAHAEKILKKQGVEILLKKRVAGIRVKGKKYEIECQGEKPFSCERALIAVGRVPNTDGLGIDELGVKTDSKGRIDVDAAYATSIEGVYAIGDVIAGPMLAHKAQEEGIACIDRLITGYGHVDYDAVPNVVYTHPEIAGVGKTEEQIKKDGREYRRGVFPFRASGRAHTLGQTDGIVKVLADEKTDRVLGVHILGPRAGDLIAEAATAIAFGSSSEDLARACHAHPTLPEALKEAALAVAGRSIHS